MRHNKVHPQRAVLPAAFDDIPGLRVKVGLGEVLDFKLPDPTRLVQPRAPRLECLIEREERRALCLYRLVHQVDGKVPMRVGLRDAVGGLASE